MIVVKVRTMMSVTKVTSKVIMEMMKLLLTTPAILQVSWWLQKLDFHSLGRDDREEKKEILHDGGGGWRVGGRE